MVGAALLCFACNGAYTITVVHLCRGDSFPADADTSLVRCSTLDSLARR